MSSALLGPLFFQRVKNYRLSSYLWILKSNHVLGGSKFTPYPIWFLEHSDFAS